MKVKNGDSRNQRTAEYESRFYVYNESEANLLGAVFTNTGIMTATPYKVTAANH